MAGDEIGDCEMNRGTSVAIRYRALAAMLGFIGGAVHAQNNGPLLLVTLRGENSLVIIDATTEKVLGRVETGEDPHNAVMSDDGKLVFITNRNGGSISVVDWAARKELHRVQIGPGSRPHGIVFGGWQSLFHCRSLSLDGLLRPGRQSSRLALGAWRKH